MDHQANKTTSFIAESPVLTFRMHFLIEFSANEFLQNDPERVLQLKLQIGHEIAFKSLPSDYNFSLHNSSADLN